MNEITIRSAMVDDFPTITDLSIQLGYSVDETTMKSRLKAILISELDCVYVAAYGNAIIGWIHGNYNMRVESEAFAEICGLVVDQNNRRKGVGLSLIEKVKEWAGEKKCSKLRVRTNIVRAESQVFYKTLGFEEVKTQKVFDIWLDLVK